MNTVLKGFILYIISQTLLFLPYYFLIYKNEENKTRILASILVPLPIAFIIAFIYFILIDKVCSVTDV